MFQLAVAEERGSAASERFAVWSPAPGAEMYDVVKDAACHVIGPLVPRTYRLTARFWLGRVGSVNRTGSLATSLPAAPFQ